MNPKNEDPSVDLSWRRYLLPHLNKEGVRFVLLFLLATIILWVIWMPLGLVGLLLTVFTFYFFRDPNRVITSGDNLLVAPADGIISNIKEVIPSPEMDMGDAPLTRISIFMSVFNVHVNRAPLSGTIHKAFYRKGKFVSVADKDSEDNEREEYTLLTSAGFKIGFVQIAGLVARRIVSYVHEGDSIQKGDRFGLIRFGSRLDVFLPKGAKVNVLLGQVAIAGETVLANVKDCKVK